MASIGPLPGVPGILPLSNVNSPHNFQNAKQTKITDDYFSKEINKKRQELVSNCIANFIAKDIIAIFVVEDTCKSIVLHFEHSNVAYDAYCNVQNTADAPKPVLNNRAITSSQIASGLEIAERD
ncbi:hypothetical protein QTP88_004013 [Uroleucon formosanum]